MYRIFLYIPEDICFQMLSHRIFKQWHLEVYIMNDEEYFKQVAESKEWSNKTITSYKIATLLVYNPPHITIILNKKLNKSVIDILVLAFL